MAEKTKLLTSFPPVTKEQWEAVITADLKGADRTKKLVWRTLEGFDVEPYYRAEDLTNLKHMDCKPAEFPYVRGTKTTNNWLVRQTVKVTDVKEANRLALEILCLGVDSLGFEIKGKEFDDAKLKTLLANIDLKAVEIAFTGCSVAKVVPMFAQYLAANYADVADKITATFNVDPMTKAAKKGVLCAGAIDKMVEMIKTVENFKRVKVIAVGGDFFNSCGSNATQELAFSLAAAHEVIVSLMEKGISINQAAASIKFNMAISANYFLEIAKFRAARMLWANIVKQYNPTRGCAEKMSVNAVTSLWNMSLYDPHVNILRATTEAMSAAVAGVNSVEVRPYDTPFADASDFSMRIARNVQLLLKEESHFDAVADPSSGSYYIETLTDKIANAAWELFKTVEAKGGYMAALKEGFIQNEIKTLAAKRDKNIATRREIILGANQYPNFTETAAPEITMDMVTKTCATSSCGCAAKAEFDTLTPYRGAMPFEELRLKTDRSTKEPLAFMLTCGSLSFARARAQFACNFFATAGIKAQDNTYFKSVEEGAKAALNAKADIVVICASDDDYLALAVEANKLLAGKAIVVVAGEPACREELEKAGVNHFISARSNVLETLKQYQSELAL